MINEKSYKCNEVMCLSLGPLMAGGEAMCYYFPLDPTIRVGVGKTIRAETESCKKKHFGIINVFKNNHHSVETRVCQSRKGKYPLDRSIHLEHVLANPSIFT